MSLRHLDRLLSPASLAVVGASDRPGSLGAALWQAVRQGGFTGALWPVNLNHAELDGVPAFARPADLPQPPELALVCTPAATVASVLAELGERGCRVAVLCSAAMTDEDLRAATDAARAHGLRLVGPGSAGVWHPAAGLHAGLAAAPLRPGPVALVAQSAALTQALLAEADRRGLGFSHVVSLGGQADVDLADLLDRLASDAKTHAILLQAGSLAPGRRFLTAARAAARRKPVAILKTGRTDATADAVLDAALARAGVLRVDSPAQLLLAGQALADPVPIGDDPLTILAPTIGPLQLAADAAFRSGMPALARALPADAMAETWLAALEAAGSGPRLLIPTSRSGPPAAALASALLPRLRSLPGRTLACWIGSPAPAAWVEAGIACHATPDEAVQGLQLEQGLHRLQRQLLETPSAHPSSPPDTGDARTVMARALADGRTTLQPDEARRVLGAFGIATCEAPPPAARALRAGTWIDPDFGPVLGCGDEHGFACTLPPLHRGLAHELPAYLGLGEHRAECAALLTLLEALSGMLEALPALAELRLQPLWVGPEGARVQAATIRIADPPPGGAARFAVRPYPADWAREVDWQGRRVVLRAIRPEDEPQHGAFLQSLAAEDLRLRFFHARRDLSHEELARMTQVDHERELAFVAESEDRTLGVVRAAIDTDGEEAEFGIVVRSDLKRGGLGRLLLQRLVDHLRAQGVQRLAGLVLDENLAMRRLAEQFGMRLDATRGEPGVACWVLDLQE